MPYNWNTGMRPAEGFGIRSRNNMIAYNANNGPYMNADQAYTPRVYNDDPRNVHHWRENQRLDAVREERERRQRLEAERLAKLQRENEEERTKYTKAKNRILVADMEIARLRDELRKANGDEPTISEEKKVCKLCFDREINATFSCGHTSCYICALQTIETFDCCAFCKQKGVTAIRLYID